MSTNLQRCLVLFVALMLLPSAVAFTSVVFTSKNYRVSELNFVAHSLSGSENGRRLASHDKPGPFPLSINHGRRFSTHLTLLTTSSSSSEMFNETIIQPATLDHAERYTSADWLRALLTIPRSNLLRRVSFHLFGNTLFAFLVWMAYTKWPIQMKMLTAGFNPQHMLLLSNALALLLVFRTNTAYDRFWEARRLWEFLISRIREVRVKFRLDFPIPLL
jgi:hypothetical protein